MDDSLLPRIDMARTTMRPAEAQVAAVILAKPDWTLAASTSQLAEAAGVSPRDCRALLPSPWDEWLSGASHRACARLISTYPRARKVLSG
ncbi:hypothetical protein CUAC110533_07345 [Cutibacterium acnes subsp. elongatum]